MIPFFSAETFTPTKCYSESIINKHQRQEVRYFKYTNNGKTEQILKTPFRTKCYTQKYPRRSRIQYTAVEKEVAHFLEQLQAVCKHVVK